MNKYIGIEGNKLRMKTDWEKPELDNPRHYRLRAAYEAHLASLPVIQAEFEVEVGREYVEDESFEKQYQIYNADKWKPVTFFIYDRYMGDNAGFKRVVALPISKQEASPEVSKEGEGSFHPKSIDDNVSNFIKTCYQLLVGRGRSAMFEYMYSYDTTYQVTIKANPTPSPSPTIKSAEACGVCGSAKVFIRGKYPRQDKRPICPCCAYERLEQINDLSSPSYGIPSTASQFRDIEPSK